MLKQCKVVFLFYNEVHAWNGSYNVFMAHHGTQA